MSTIRRVDNEMMRSLVDRMADSESADPLHGSIACEPGKFPEDYPPPQDIAVTNEPIIQQGDLAIYYWVRLDVWDAHTSG